MLQLHITPDLREGALGRRPERRHSDGRSGDTRRMREARVADGHQSGMRHVGSPVVDSAMDTGLDARRIRTRPRGGLIPRDRRVGCLLLALCDCALLAAAAVGVYMASTGFADRAALLYFLVTSFLSFVTAHTLAQSYKCERLARMSHISRASFILTPTVVSALAIGFAIGLEMVIGRSAGLRYAGSIELPVNILPELILLGVVTGGVALGRAVLYVTLHRLNAAGYLATNVVVFGAGHIGQRLIRVIRQDYPDSVEICGLFDDRLERTAREVMGLPLAGGIDDLVRLVSDGGEIDKVLIALPMSAQGRILALLEQLRPLPVDIALVPELVDVRLDKQVIRDPHPPFLNLSRRPQTELGVVMKRAFDIAAALGALVLLSPLMALTALAIKLDSPGPVLFRQPRMGFNNRQFHVLKFRTMYADKADLGAQKQTRRGDARITRLGNWLRRTSIDELPQLLNVLRGDMSLVGPRPHALGMQVHDRPCDDIVREYAVRHRMKPGITGWAQVCGLRGAVEEPSILEARIHHDIYYIDNWSFVFDLWILVMTVGVLVRPRNAF